MKYYDSHWFTQDESVYQFNLTNSLPNLIGFWFKQGHQGRISLNGWDFNIVELCLMIWSFLHASITIPVEYYPSNTSIRYCILFQYFNSTTIWQDKHFAPNYILMLRQADCPHTWLRTRHIAPRSEESSIPEWTDWSFLLFLWFEVKASFMFQHVCNYSFSFCQSGISSTWLVLRDEQGSDWFPLLVFNNKWW